MNIIKTNMKEISRDEFLRCDAKFHMFFLKNNWNLFASNKDLITLNDILIEDKKIFEIDDNTEYYGIPTGQSYVDEDGDIIYNQVVTKENKPGRLKYKVNENNILISSLKLAKVPALNFTSIDFDKYIFSNGFYILKIKNNWNKKFVLYLLRNSEIKNLIDNHIFRGIGISSYKLKDLLKIEVPNIGVDKQADIVAKINPIEENIKRLKGNRLDVNEIINDTFNKYFGLNYINFEELKKIKVFNTELTNFAKNVDTRFSVKFQRPAAQFVINELNQLTNKRIKDYTVVPLMTGKGISPKDYDENGDCKYASMAEISSWMLDIDNMRLVSKPYERLNSTKKPNGCTASLDTKIQKGDILMIRSGEGSIGKVALVENHVDAIFSDFVIRIRLENYNSKFAYYYFRTLYFQYLIEIYKKGLGNNTNIFPTVLQEFPIPNVSLEIQNTIVDIIDDKIELNRSVDNEIELEREKISNIINKYLF